MKKNFVLLANKFAKLDWILLGAVALLCSMGLLELYSLSPSLKDGLFLFHKQIVFIFIGFILMFWLSFTDYSFLREKSVLIFTIFLLGVASLISLLFWSRAIGGSRSWFSLGIINFEPVEIVKITLILVLAKFFSTRHIKSSTLRPILKSLFYVIVPAVLVILQPDMGSASILILIWLGIAMLSGMNRKHLIGIFLLSLVLISIFWVYFLQDYQKNRILFYLEPEKDPWGHGYNVIQSLSAISSGGFFGKGIGQGSTVQLGFLPARHNDFIFSSICEEMGLLGGMIVLGMYGIVFWRLSIISLKVRDNFGLLIIGGVLALFVSQCFINLGINTGIIPVTGLSLPFVSYGGSGIIASFIALGLALSVVRQIS